jgi:hypothetical protein
VGLVVGNKIMRGKRSAISTSKIRKITAIKKNRREKGSREDLLGSNPHSKGELFSRSIIDFLDSRVASIITMEEMRIRIKPKVSMTRIIYFEIIQTF